MQRVAGVLEEQAEQDHQQPQLQLHGQQARRPRGVEQQLAHGWEALTGLSGVQRLDVARVDGWVERRLALAQEAVIADVISAVAARNARLLFLSKEKLSLEEAFIRLTGSRMEEAGRAPEA